MLFMNTNTQTELVVPDLIIKDGTFVSDEQFETSVEILNQNFDSLNVLMGAFKKNKKDSKHVVIVCFDIREEKGKNLAGKFTHGRTLPLKNYYCTFASREVFASCVKEDREDDSRLDSDMKGMLLVLFEKGEYFVFCLKS